MMVVSSATITDDEDTISSNCSLESILENPNSDLFKQFTLYLNQSYCIENLEFWLAAQEYYVNYNNNQEQLAETMVNLYIKPNSPQEINIPCEMRQKILGLYKQRIFTSHLFEEAAEAILELMRVNSFLPWIHKSSSSYDWPSSRHSSLDLSSVNSGTRYKSMLKRIKKSLLLGQTTANNNRKSNDSSILDTFFTPRSSILNDTSFWKKSQN